MSKSRQVRKYDHEFKQRAVQLYRTNEKSYETISEELGIPAATLVGWVKNPRYADLETTSGQLSVQNSEFFKEFKSLKRELSIAQEERDILKKALAIFSVDVPKR
jgi:transposase